MKAKVKIKKLKEESLSQQRQKKLIAEQKRKEALLEKMMRNRKRSARQAREHMDVAQSVADEIQQRSEDAAAAASDMPMMGDITGIDASLAGVSVDVASVGAAGVATGAVSVGADVAVAVQSIDVSI